MFFFQVVQLLLSNANGNEPIDDAVGLTPLHLAVISNQIEVAKVF
jgi:ankyrin repeat protein